MARVKRGTKRRARRKKYLKRAKGFFLTKSKLYRAAHEAVERALRYGYRDRRNRKRQFRELWIERIGAAARSNGLSYSQFIHGLKLGGVEIDRKVLADLAVQDATAFSQLAETARQGLAGGNSGRAQGHVGR
jgi:large subunit ribosomal protein L20